MATTLNDLLAGTGGRKIYLATLTLGVRLRDWAPTAGYGNTFEIGFAGEEAGLSREIARIEENGVEYTEKSSPAEVDAAGSAYYWDSASGKLYISPAGPNPTAGSTFIVAWFEVRLSNESHDGGGRPLVLDGRWYAPILTGISPISARSTDLFGSIGSAPSTCRLMLANAGGELDATLGEWIWVGGEADVLFGGEDLPLEEYEPIFRGNITEAVFEDPGITLTLESGERIFTRSVPPNSFSLSDYPGLEESNVGKPLPLVIGQVKNIQPVRVSHSETYRIEFDGVSNYLRRAKTDLDCIGFTGSLSAELKLTLLSANDSGTIFGIWSEANNKRSYQLHIYGSDRKLRFYASDTGSTWPNARADTTVLQPFHEYLVRVAYDAPNHAAFVRIDGVTQSIYYSATLPTSILAADGDFCIGCTHGLTNPLKCRVRELTLASGYQPGTEPLTQVVSRWTLNKTAVDEEGRNDLEAINFGEGDYKLNYGLRLCGTGYAFITDAEASGLDITGPITLAVRIQPREFLSRQGILAKWAEATNQRSWLLELQNEGVRLCLSTDGSASYIIYTTGTTLQLGQWYEIKATYDTVTKVGKIYINGQEVSSSSTGTAPSALFNSTADVRVGAMQLGTNCFNGVIDWAAVAGSYQPDSGPVSAAVSYWEFDRNLQDSLSSNNLSPYEIESDDYIVLSTESEYKIADDSLQRLKSVDSVRDGEIELLGADYEADLDNCTLKLNVSVADCLIVDVHGATMGDLLGDGSQAAITRAAHATKFLLKKVAGQRAELFDDASFEAGSREAPMELNLYLKERRDLGSVLKELCDSVFADIKVRRGTYSFEVYSPGASVECVELNEEDLSGFSCTVDPSNIWREISVLYNQDGSGGCSFVSAQLPEALLLYGRELARREFATRLTSEGDALVFLEVAKLLARSRQLIAKARVITPRLMASQVGNRVRLTRLRAPGGALERSTFEITEINKDYATGTCDVVLSSLRGLGIWIARFTAPDHPVWGSSDEGERQEGGYFTDDEGRADPSEPSSGGRNLFWR
jgi:hypothetical protein